MNFRNISSWCIRNPVGPIVLFVGLMLAGLISFAQMQVNNAPDIDFPAAIVTVSQPGAAPNELETQVTQRVESAIRGVNGVDEMNSTVGEGYSSTFVSFQLGTPTDRAVNDVRNAIAQIRGTLPDGILEPQITRIDAEGEPISYVGAQTTDMTLEQLKHFRQLDSLTPGHPENFHTPAIETTTGPLGQGIATSIGFAVAEKMLAAEFGKKIVNHHTYVLCSDGDLMEGVSQEAIALAGHWKLNKLIVLYDDNGISIDGPTSIADSVDQVKRFKSAGWQAERIDGHDPSVQHQIGQQRIQHRWMYGRRSVVVEINPRL